MSSQIGNIRLPLFSFSCTTVIVSLAGEFASSLLNGKINLKSGTQKFGLFGGVTSSLKVVKGFWKVAK